ncbi:MAG: xanthine dehydrogenase family protein molybdopterin-binding subunit [Chloroflexota bacterium]
MAYKKSVGQSIPKVDALAKVTGKATYISDFSRPGMLVGKILASDRPHARIVSIETSEAVNLPGVEAVITASDGPNHPYGNYLFDRSAFASDRVRHIGEPIAAVAAVNEVVAQAALELIKVEYEDLPAVFSPEEALAPDAAILHPDLAEYASIFPYIRYENTCMDARLSLGNIKEGFDQADHIFTETYTTKPMHQAYLEPWACVADFDQDGRLTVWTGTQQLSICHQEVAAALGLPLQEVRVIPLWMGGAFGGKLGARFEPIAALLTRASGRPVKLNLTRKEDFMMSHPRPPYTIHFRAGAQSDGTIVAWEADILVDVGSYADEAIGTSIVALAFSKGPYCFPNCEGQVRAIYTNNPDWGCMRGYGGLQMGFATECFMDLIAEELEIDPVELRLKNLAGEEDHNITGQKFEEMAIKETMQAALKAAKYQTKKGNMGTNRGIGVANIISESGLLSSSAGLRVNGNGSCTILTSVTDLGTGTYTAFCQIAADVLGISAEDIHVGSPDSDSSPFDSGSFASRTVQDTGKAVLLAAEDVRDQLIELAASVFECKKNVIIWEKGQAFHKDNREQILSLVDLIGISKFVRGGPILGRGSLISHEPFKTLPGKGFSTYPTTYLVGTHIAEVEVDPKTGICKVLNITAGHDVGKAINPDGVEGQIEGGVVQGVGYGLMEELVVEEGEIKNPSFATYPIPTVLDIPPIQSVIIEEPGTSGPFGAKGIGEPPSIGPMAAIANAIYDAVGVRVKEIPITAEKLCVAINDQRKEVSN